MACPVLDKLFELGERRGRGLSIEVSLQYVSFDEPPEEPGNVTGTGTARLQYSPGQVYSFTVDHATVLDSVPARFFGQLTYAGQSTALQISAPRIALLPAAFPYSVTFGANPGVLNGSFAAGCDSFTIELNPPGVYGIISGQAGAVQVQMTLSWPA